MDTAAHRLRARTLCERYPFAAEVLTLYLALLDVWDGVPAPSNGDPIAWAARQVLPEVVAAAGRSGPEPLAAAARDIVAAGQVERWLAAWLDGAEVAPVERFLARASLRTALAGRADVPGSGGSGCPRCGGLPQLSYRGDGDDPLVSGRRHLVCARCGGDWTFSASTCPSCGETTGAARTVYAEPHAGPPVVGRDEPHETTVFPHLRLDACASCRRYLVDVDLGRDARAVPEVDELAAVPLDLYAAERGLTKITPNLMGF